MGMTMSEEEVDDKPGSEGDGAICRRATSSEYGQVSAAQTEGRYDPSRADQGLERMEICLRRRC